MNDLLTAHLDSKLANQNVNDLLPAHVDSKRMSGHSNSKKIKHTRTHAYVHTYTRTTCANDNARFVFLQCQTFSFDPTSHIVDS